MEVIIQKDPAECVRLAARIFVRQLQIQPNAVLGLATGRTMIPLYAELVRNHREGRLKLKRATVFNLDEYVGIPSTDAGSFRRFLDDHFVNRVDINPARVHLPSARGAETRNVGLAYEKAIEKAGGIDLQVLGIGQDGHIGFNEPTSSLASRTRIKTLTRQTRRDNAEPFGSWEKVPAHAITMGIGTILESRRIILLAFGKSKAAAIAKMVEGPVTAMVPASALQFHPDVKVIVDEAAGSRLRNKRYYKETLAGKPEWQKL